MKRTSPKINMSISNMGGWHKIYKPVRRDLFEVRVPDAKSTCSWCLAGATAWFLHVGSRCRPWYSNPYTTMYYKLHLNQHPNWWYGTRYDDDTEGKIWNTSHCFQWNILYRWSCGVIVMNSCLKFKIRNNSFTTLSFITIYRSMWPPVQNVPFEAMHLIWEVLCIFS